MAETVPKWDQFGADDREYARHDDTGSPGSRLDGLYSGPLFSSGADATMMDEPIAVDFFQATQTQVQIYGYDDDADAPPPMHVSLLPGGEASTDKASRKQKKSAFTPADETPSQRDERTVFIGNLPIDAAKSKVRCTPHTSHCPR